MRGMLGTHVWGKTPTWSDCSCPHSAAAYCRVSTLCVSCCSSSIFLNTGRSFAELLSAQLPQEPRTTPGMSRRQPGLPHQQFLSIAVCAVPVQAEVQHFQARAACHHYAGKRCNSGLHARGYALAIHLVVDVNLQASHLHVKLRVFARRAAAVLSARSWAAIFHMLSCKQT